MRIIYVHWEKWLFDVPNANGPSKSLDQIAVTCLVH